MKEVGGYFELDKFVENEFHKDLIAVNNGRNALLYLMKVNNINKIHIPYYLCDSVSDMLKRYGYNFEYYFIDSNFKPIFSKELNDDEYLYVVNYFGQLSDEYIVSLKHKFNKIIMDNTHAFFQKPIKGVNTLYSCRKFFGVPDGAYLSTEILLHEKLEKDVSKDRMTHILGRYEGSAKEYYSFFKENDASFKYEALKYMSRLTRNILGAIDYNKVQHTRDTNFEFLKNSLSDQNKIKLNEPFGAFCYPLYLDNGLEVRAELANKNIYIPTLWPNVMEDIFDDAIEYEFASNILPLPCDQRYDENDMEYLIKEVFKCMS
ncbi:hypothetical protein [Salisediminibacterium beveridgei]|uniref:dTDP-4-amino-4,6-dideoxygalactose transaminase n=1 Tax=Salisediminibacterium beveridgei TaxID=632773 RepID=A0A1D7QRM9_9BACI|nr:hypothetical protein [Salisediminibacterium beveridgei]AOM81668.1 hypothetical protein BBEV_0274 [Salisediminibacterium beveridgei]